ncbi:BT_3987 domain-containing protein [uncultured Bacteroides sp.]|uniref:BT_3987 domain-containing protein n=1 Tax=uncultured Bacteroides sp. TaxID=162156 RepID=UPI002AABDFCF|nr:DUF1735 domain-containing protein [uncultured Bacteroides sp.]
MKTNIYKYFSVCFLLIVPLLQSCDSDESYDVVGNPNNLFYINLSSSSSVDSPNTLAFSVVHTPIGDFGDVKAEFPVRCLRQVDETTKVTMQLDNSLIDEYNEKYETSYVAFPDGSLNLDSPTATIQEGTYIAKDSLVASVPASAFASFTESGYIAPVRIASVKGSAGKGSEDYGIGYIIVKTSTKLIKSGVASADMPGTLVTDYSDWSISSTQSTSNDFSTLIDNETWSGWDFTSSTATVIVDMQSEKEFTGIRSFCVYGMYASWGYYFSNIALEYSVDGNTYMDAGNSSDLEMINEDGYQYIALYSAVTARYLKITYTCNSEWGRGLYELGVYTDK